MSGGIWRAMYEAWPKIDAAHVTLQQSLGESKSFGGDGRSQQALIISGGGAQNNVKSISQHGASGHGVGRGVMACLWRRGRPLATCTLLAGAGGNSQRLAASAQW